jgi:hypothetical protein
MNPMFVSYLCATSGLGIFVKNIWNQLWPFVCQFFEWYTQSTQRGLCDIGFPEAYGMGIDKRWRESYGFWVVRNHEGICVVMEGEKDPWVWPLVRVAVIRDETGCMWVNLRKRFYYEKDEWRDAESFLFLDERGDVTTRVRSMDKMD